MAACRDGRSKKSRNRFRELVAHAAHDGRYASALQPCN
jgi:hypothetical protein